MTDERAAQIVRGLSNDKNPRRWKIWLLSGLFVFLARITGGGIFLTMRPPSAPVPRDPPELAAVPETTRTFMRLLLADMPQGGWINPEAEMMRRNLDRHLRARKQATPPHAGVSVRR